LLKKRPIFKIQIKNFWVKFIQKKLIEKLMLNMHLLVKLAEFERELLAEQTRAGLASARARGLRRLRKMDATSPPRVRS
jgi:DNA invertase Pin-like site-specific DNA recombinase